MLIWLKYIDFARAKSEAPINKFIVYSGAPVRAKHVRTYLRVYRLYGWGRGDYQKEGSGVSGVSRQVHIFNIGF